MREQTILEETRQSGFTLVELMVALVLGLLVIGGVLGVFVANQQSYRSNHALGNVQDASRIAFEMISRDIRGAGMSGCGNTVISNATNSTAWWGDWTQPLRGYDDATTDPALSALTGDGAPVSSSGSIRLLSVSGSSASFSAQSSLVGSAISLNETGATFAANQIVVVCQPDDGLIGQLSAASAGSITFAAEGAGSPGNNSTISSVFAINSLVTPLNATIWYIGTNPTGSTSLYRLSLVGGAETVQEMVRDVSELTLEYHTPGTADYVDASSISDWSAVNTVRATMTTERRVTQASTSDLISRSFETTIALRGRLY